MILLIGFAFLAGVVTVLSPCILPVLPLILSSTLGGENIGKSRPLGVVVGFIASFTFFTLFLSAIVQSFGISANTLRTLSVVVIALFGVSLLVPRFQVWLEQAFSKFSVLVPKNTNKKGFGPGFVIGLSLGLLWTPCVGPILASVISLALSGDVSLATFFITLAYALGTAIPMLAIMIGGRTLLSRVPWLLRNTGNIQKAFGVLMILTALAIVSNLDRSFQTFIINIFPKYGAGLTKFEENTSIQKELSRLRGEEGKQGNKNMETGKPMFDLLPKGPKAPELIPGGVWINSEPLTLEELKGKVVIVDFWTYSCINCQRTLPYLKKWYEKYADKGLVIIGVHAPEFEFEKSEKNLRKAVADFDLKYPIVQDNDFATWRAYSNRFWPAKYFIDKDGYVRYTHFGEGAYDESEKVIQELLSETGAEGVSQVIENSKTEASYVRTPESYLGYERLARLASPERIVHDKETSYSAPKNLGRNDLAYIGSWTVAGEYAHPGKGAALEIDFEAKEVFLVMRPKSGAEEASIKVSVDGELSGLGSDVENGVVTVKGDQLYKLVRLPVPGRHVLKLEFLDGNAELYAFTFG